ncbi:MAG TPA: DUF4416 family protein [bacterium]|nr:DUF4416 family protein [bacterium]
MGIVKNPDRVQLFCGVINTPDTNIDEVGAVLAEEFGEIDMRSDVLDFDFTDFYEGEMGAGLKRVFFAFEKLIDPSEITSIKLKTNELELKFAEIVDDKVMRKVNLDPGYLTPAKMLLATTKDYFHRVYIGDGIYAEVTLVYRRPSFAPFEWTYPDYKTEEYIDFFNKLRIRYRNKLRFAGSEDENLA